jgi:hypothetical protein
MEGKKVDGRCPMQKELLFLSSHPASHPTGIEPLTPATHQTHNQLHYNTQSHEERMLTCPMCPTRWKYELLRIWRASFWLPCQKIWMWVGGWVTLSFSTKMTVSGQLSCIIIIDAWIHACFLAHNSCIIFLSFEPENHAWIDASFMHDFSWQRNILSKFDAGNHVHGLMHEFLWPMKCMHDFTHHFDVVN